MTLPGLLILMEEAEEDILLLFKMTETSSFMMEEIPIPGALIPSYVTEAVEELSADGIGIAMEEDGEQDG
jgi:hypothetical protein